MPPMLNWITSPGWSGLVAGPLFVYSGRRLLAAGQRPHAWLGIALILGGIALTTEGAVTALRHLT